MAHLSGINIGTFARTLAAALLLGTAIMTFTPGQTAYAARAISSEAGDTDTGGGFESGPVVVYQAKVTKGGLEGQGYTCTKAGVDFWECTKPGATTYWCNSSSCQPKPRTASWETTVPRGSMNATTQP